MEPGDRLLLQVVEVDVPTGHYRLTVSVSDTLTSHDCVAEGTLMARNSLTPAVCFCLQDRLDDNRSASSTVVTEELVLAEEGEEEGGDGEFAAGAAVEQWLAAGDDLESSSSSEEQAAAVSDTAR